MRVSVCVFKVCSGVHSPQQGLKKKKTNKRLLDTHIYIQCAHTQEQESKSTHKHTQKKNLSSNLRRVGCAPRPH